MKKIFIVVFAFVCTTSIAQTIDSSWIVNHYKKKELHIPMRDGIKLFTSVYMPKDTVEKHPIIFIRTPYSCAPYGENIFAKLWYSNLLPYVQEHYIIVLQDVRGRWMSEGDFEKCSSF